MNENTIPEKEKEIIDDYEIEDKEEGFDPRQYPPGYEQEEEFSFYDDETEHKKETTRFHWWVLPALAPFIYVVLGLMLGGWFWAWGWVIIPVSSIVSVPMPFWVKFVSLSPFIYVMLGMFFGAWAWAWMIIPVSGILGSGVKRSKR